MFKMPEKIIYALPEQIGNPDLFAGRKQEFDYFLGDWYNYLEKNFTPNTAIVSRRKKGKTSFLQRLFNILWSTCMEKKTDDLKIIPFYYSISDSEMSLGNFAEDFFTAFIYQYASYKRKDTMLVTMSYDFNNLSDIIDNQYVMSLYESMRTAKKENNSQKMWRIASKAPATVGRLTGDKCVQIIDEFQNINEYIYDDDKKRLDSLSKSYMTTSELREAPLIISGSEVHWLLRIVRSLTGRFQTRTLSNLPKEEALLAMDSYAEFSNTRINDNSRQKIWVLTKGDPLYIKALFLNVFNQKKDFTVDENIVDVYEKEISQGEIFTTWMEYMLNTFDTVNKINSKRIMLYLFQQGKERTRAEIIKDLKLNYTDLEAEEKLNALIAGDLISQGSTGFRYKITKDKTYELVFRKVYQDEIEHFIPDIKAEIWKMIGMGNYLRGKFTEFPIKERLKKSFNLMDICVPEKDLKIIPKTVKEREIIAFGVKKYEIDLIIKTSNKSEVWIDVKNTRNRYGKNEMKRWLNIIDLAKEEKRKIIFIVYSEYGFTKGTKETLIENGVFIIKKELN